MAKVVLSPLESGKYIANLSKHVSISEEGIGSTARMIVESILKQEFGIQKWKAHTLNPKVANEAAIDWIFLADLLNFSFWSEDDTNKFTVKYQDKSYTGYWSLCAAINRAIDEGINVTDPRYYQHLTMTDVRRLFRSDSGADMPMLEERLEHMTQAGSLLVQKYNGSFLNCIKQCDNSSEKLLNLIVSEFPSFRDEADYNGRRVSFYKRAQILIADVWACFEGEGHGQFDDIDNITMFADYRIPQALAYFNILSYSRELQELLDKGHMFTSGDGMEVELRGCSIWATQLLTERVQWELAAVSSGESAPSPSPTVNAILIDHFIWDYRREHDQQTKHIPFHRIRCPYY